MKSVLQDKKECYMCRELYDIDTTFGLEEHHIFGGANRPLSEKYGLKVYLCQAHHNTAPLGVHFDYNTMKWLRRKGQQAFEKTHSREEFIKIFGRNYDTD